MATGQQRKEVVTPLALVTADGDCRTCPDYDTTIDDGSMISIIAHPGFDWDAFETDLAGRKG